MAAVTGRPLLIFILLCIALLLDATAEGAVPALLPAFLKPLHYSHDGAGFLLGVKAFADLACIIPCALLINKLGYRPVLTTGLLCVVISGVLLSLPAPSLWRLAIAMCLLGVNAQVSFTAAMVMATELFGETGIVGCDRQGASKAPDQIELNVATFPIDPSQPGKLCSLKDSFGRSPQDQKVGLVAAPTKGDCQADQESEALLGKELEGEPPEEAGLTQVIGVLMGTEAMGLVIGPFLLPILYSCVGHWVPFSAISGLILVLLIPLLLLRRNMGSNAVSDPEATCSKVGSWETAETGIVKESANSGVEGLWNACNLAARSPQAITAVIVIFSESFADTVVNALVPIHLTTCGYSLTQVGLFFGASALTYALVASFGLRILTARLGGMPTMLMGSAVLGMSQWVLTLRGSCGWEGQIPALIGVGLGMSLMGGPGFVQLENALSNGASPVDEVFSVMLYNTTFMVAALLGSNFAPVFAEAISYTHTLQLNGGLLFLTVPLIIGINRFSHRRSRKLAKTRSNVVTLDDFDASLMEVQAECCRIESSR